MSFARLRLGPLPWALGSFGPSQGAFWLSLGPSGSHGTEWFLVVLLGRSSNTQILRNCLVEQCNTAFDNCHQKHKLIMRDTKTSSVSDMAREYMGSIVVGHRFALFLMGRSILNLSIPRLLLGQICFIRSEWCPIGQTQTRKYRKHVLANAIQSSRNAAQRRNRKRSVGPVRTQCRHPTPIPR